MKKILIVRFSSIGDIVLTTPVIRAVKQQTGAEVHFLTKEAFYPVLQGNPCIDKIHTIKKSVTEVAEQLQGYGFDLVIDLHKNLRTARLRSLLRCKTVSFSKLNVRKWLIVNAKIDILPDKHLVDRCFEPLAPFGIKNDGQGLDYFIPQEEEVALADLPGFLHGSFIGIVVGGKHQTKIFPAEKVVSLIRKMGRPVVLLGGPEDKERAEEIRRSAPELVFNGCGAFSVNQSASVINKADVIITNDTGLMHIAAALKKKIVALWGNTIPQFGMYPYFSEDKKSYARNIEVGGLACRPCSKIGYEKCPKGHFHCMMKIEEEKIIEAVKSLQKDYS